VSPDVCTRLSAGTDEQVNCMKAQVFDLNYSPKDHRFADKSMVGFYFYCISDHLSWGVQVVGQGRKAQQNLYVWVKELLCCLSIMVKKKFLM